MTVLCSGDLNSLPKFIMIRKINKLKYWISWKCAWFCNETCELECKNTNIVLEKKLTDSANFRKIKTLKMNKMKSNFGAEWMFCLWFCWILIPTSNTLLAFSYFMRPLLSFFKLWRHQSLKNETKWKSDISTISQAVFRNLWTAEIFVFSFDISKHRKEKNFNSFLLKRERAKVKIKLFW